MNPLCYEATVSIAWLTLCVCGLSWRGKPRPNWRPPRKAAPPCCLYWKHALVTSKTEHFTNYCFFCFPICVCFRVWVNVEGWDRWTPYKTLCSSNYWLPGGGGGHWQLDTATCLQFFLWSVKCNQNSTSGLHSGCWRCIYPVHTLPLFGFHQQCPSPTAIFSTIHTLCIGVASTWWIQHLFPKWSHFLW